MTGAKMKEEQSDHDLLIVMNTKLDILEKQFSNHLKHHFLFTLSAWGVTLAALIGLILK